MKRLLLAAAALVWLGALAAAEVPRRPVLLTGEVVALDSQPILVPAANGGPVLLRNFVAEGTVVKRGDLVLRIDANEGMNISKEETELEQAAARARREWTDLIVKGVDAAKELRVAEAALNKARVDAALPKSLVPAIDFDRYQGELVRTRHDLEVKQQALANAQAAVQRRQADGDLEAKKLGFNVQFLKSLVSQAEVRAERDGIVVHTYSEWRGERNDEGSSAFAGNTVGYVIGDGETQVRAWALEADRTFLAVDQSVRVTFDALPALVLTGKIARIASAPQLRAAWGSGRYFQVDVALPAGNQPQLVSGMSALVEPLKGAPPPIQQPTSTAALQLEGEIASRRALPVSPPQISEVWQFNLSTLAPEGTLVRAGEPVAVFEVADLKPQLDAKQSMLNEKLRALDKLELDQREATRTADIDVAEARSNTEKAERKVSQPKDQIRRVDYDKLVIDSELAHQQSELALQHRAARAEARAAERSALDVDIKRLRSDIARLESAIASLTVTAKAPGLVLYRLQYNGEKFSVGKQVWRGESVATVADPQQLMVRATVPEAQSSIVQVGQRARVNVPGANLALNARVSGLGPVFHIKSRAQPVIVRDVELSFDKVPRGLKPGAAVQISLLPVQAATAVRTSSIASVP